MILLVGESIWKWCGIASAGSLYRSGRGAVSQLLVELITLGMAGRQVDVMDYSEIEGNGSDERRESDWEEVGRMRRDKKEASHKRKKKGCVSSNGTEIEKMISKCYFPENAKMLTQWT